MKKSKTLRVVVTLAMLLATAGIFVFYHYWFMPQRDVKEEKGIEVAAQTIMDGYTTNEQTANALYLDKAIQVTGEVSNISKNEAGKVVVSLKTNDPMGGIRCTMKESGENIKAGATVSIKGICTGYLMDVTLIDCYLAR